MTTSVLSIPVIEAKATGNPIVIGFNTDAPGQYHIVFKDQFKGQTYHIDGDILGLLVLEKGLFKTGSMYEYTTYKIGMDESISQARARIESEGWFAGGALGMMLFWCHNHDSVPFGRFVSPSPDVERGGEIKYYLPCIQKQMPSHRKGDSVKDYTMWFFLDSLRQYNKKEIDAGVHVHTGDTIVMFREV